MKINLSISEKELGKKREEKRRQKENSMTRRKILEEEAEKFWKEQVRDLLRV